MIIHLIDIEAYDPTVLGVVTLRYCSGPGSYSTSPAETPAGATWLPRIINPGNYRRDLFAPGTTSGASTISAGVVTLNNADGALDKILSYGLDGRRIVTRMGDHLAPLSAFTTVMTGTMEQPESDFRQLKIRIRDRQAELAKPIQPTLYAGSNILPEGLEGSIDLKGQPKPITVGHALNVSPICVNTSRLIYQVNDRAIADIPHAYDNGLELQRERVNHASGNVDPITTLSALPSQSNDYRFGCYSPVRNKAYWWSEGGSMRGIDCSNDSGFTITLTGVGSHVTSVSYDATNECIWVMTIDAVSDSTAYITKVLTSDNSFTTTTLTGHNDHYVSGKWYSPVVVYCPLNNKLYTTKWTGSGTTGDQVIQRRSVSSPATVEATFTVVSGYTLPTGDCTFGVRNFMLRPIQWLDSLGVFVLTWMDYATTHKIKIGLWNPITESLATLDTIYNLPGQYPPDYIGFELCFAANTSRLFTLRQGYSTYYWYEFGAYTLTATSAGIPVTDVMHGNNKQWSRMVYHAASENVYLSEIPASGTGNNLLRMPTLDEVPYVSVAIGTYGPGAMVPVGSYLYAPLNGARPIKFTCGFDALPDYANQAAMEATSPASGTFRVCPSLGMLRLGAQPQQLTCDVKEGSTTAARTAAQVWQRIMINYGSISSGDITAAAVTALDTATTAPVGIFVRDSRNIDDCLSAIAGSVGAWWGFDNLGQAGIYRLDAPAGSPDIVIPAVKIINLQRMASNDQGKGVPAWRVVLNYAHNYTLQNEGSLAGAVTAARRQWVVLENRTEPAEAASVKTAHLLATELKFDSLIVQYDHAKTEIARRLAMYSVIRDPIELKLPATMATLQPGQLVQVVINRFGYDAGKLFRVIGIGRDFAGGKHTATLWG